MTRGLADTSVFIAREGDRPMRSELLPDEIAASVITVAELRAGVLAASDIETRDRRLRTLTHVLSLGAVPIDGPVADAWAALRLRLRRAGLRMPVNDSWIAATAIALDVPVITQDDDYVDVPGLHVVRV